MAKDFSSIKLTELNKFYILEKFNLYMQVKDLVRNVYTIDEDFPLSKIAQIMCTKKVGEVLFMDEDVIKGIITEDDLVRNFDKGKKVTDVMTTRVITIDENRSIDDALELMNARSIKRLPVVDKKGKMIGVIKLVDIARHSKELEEDFFFE
ncbi:MAG: CBS domain-containing protein [Patescibacteria group bacterium]